MRIRRPEEAVITIAVAPRLEGDDHGGQVTDTLVWRGPRAPAGLPYADRLEGAVEDHALDSRALHPAQPDRLPATRSAGKVAGGWWGAKWGATFNQHQATLSPP